MEQPPQHRNIRLLLEYDGTAYVGWQVQPNGTSIQGVLEQALAALLQSPIRIVGAGRTDAGVHALGQVASFKTARPIPLSAFVPGLNALLPKDIAVKDAAEVSLTFDARKSARGKRYRYRIYNAPVRAPLRRHMTWQLFRPLDVGAMRRAAHGLAGEHDFAAFQGAGSSVRTTVRTLREIEVRGDLTGEIVVDLVADGFLKHMVRNIVGTLVEVGIGRRSESDVQRVLASCDRTQAGPTAPPQGLCLLEVYY